MAISLIKFLVELQILCIGVMRQKLYALIWSQVSMKTFGIADWLDSLHKFLEFIIALDGSPLFMQ